MLRPGLHNSEGRGGMKEKRESKREKGGLKKTWCFKQSNRLFAAAMFHYFRGLGIRGFSGNSHLNGEYSKSNFKHKIASSPLFEFDTRQNKALGCWKLSKTWWKISILSVSPLNDLSLTFSITKCGDTNPCELKKVIKKERKEKVRIE